MIKWSKILENHQNEVVDFASGNLTLRKLQRSVSPDVRPELRTLETKHGTQYGRRLARKALRRRKIAI